MFKRQTQIVLSKSFLFFIEQYLIYVFIYSICCKFSQICNYPLCRQRKNYIMPTQVCSCCCFVFFNLFETISSVFSNEINKDEEEASEVLSLITSMRKSPVLRPALQATPSTSTDSRYWRAGNAGVGVNSSIGVSAEKKHTRKENELKKWPQSWSQNVILQQRIFGK